MSDINHVNILYSIAISLLNKATEIPEVKISEENENSLIDWFITTRTETYSQDIKAKLGLGGNFFQIITALLKTESGFREEIKKTHEPQVSELAKKADEIAAIIQATTNKKILVVIYDLDKLDLELVDKIYKNNIKSLCLPKFQIVYTIPISAIRDNQLLGTLNGEINKIVYMKLAKFFKQGESHLPDASPNENSVNVFLDILKKRIPEDLIEPEIARQIVLKSGGVLRELVRITRECCLQCSLLMEEETERTDIKINEEILQEAIKDLRNEFARPLGSTALAILENTYRYKTWDNTTNDDFLELLHGLDVLEYENGDVWYDVHPIVVEILRLRNRI